MHTTRKTRMVGGTALAVALSIALAPMFSTAAFATDDTEPATTDSSVVEVLDTSTQETTTETAPADPAPVEAAPVEPPAEPDVAPVVTEEDVVVDEGVPSTSESRVSTMTTTVPPPSKKYCDSANDLTWTRNADLSEVTITLKSSVNACDVTLHSFETEGATWETSGDQVFVDFDSAHLTAANPTATLKVDVRGCFQQQDLAIGTKKHDGVANPVPHYNDAVYPEGLIDHYNGGKACTPPPPTNQVCTTFADGGTSTDANANGWAEFGSKPGGTATYVDGGLALNNADGNSKVSWAHSTTGGSLALLGQVAVGYDHTSGANLVSGPGLNVFVTFAPGLTGTLVGEPNAYGQDWWLTNGSNAAITAPQTGGGFGSNRHGTINEWLALYPDATFAPYFAFSYGTGGPAAGVLHSVTIACTTYSFNTQKTVVLPAAPVVTGKQACIIDPVVGEPVKQVLLTLSNPNPTAPFTTTTSVDLDIKLDGVFHETVTLAPGQTITDYEVLFNEDTGDHKVEVFNGTTRIYLLDGISSDCAPNEVTGNPAASATQTCGSVTYTFTFPAVELGTNEFIKPVTFVYTDENGVVHEVIMNAGDPAKVIKVDYKEDAGNGSVSVEYGVKGQTLTKITIDTDCKTPPTTPSGGIATDFFGQDPNAPLGGLTPFGMGAIAMMLLIGLAASAAAVKVSRRRSAVS